MNIALLYNDLKFKPAYEIWLWEEQLYGNRSGQTILGPECSKLTLQVIPPAVKADLKPTYVFPIFANSEK